MSAVNSPASLTEALSSLRKIVGNEPREADLISLLQRCKGDVNAAANAFFDGGIGSADPFPAPSLGAPPTPGMPVAEPVQQPPVVSVQCPPGVGAGDDLQVRTDAGLLRVKVPAGVKAGDSFLVRLPAPAATPVINGQPQQMGGYAGQPQQPMMYPGQQQQPQVIMQQQPQVHVVHAAPYYGGYGYGYGYGDPFLAGTMGFMGGMLIADAMFW